MFVNVAKLQTWRISKLSCGSGWLSKPPARVACRSHSTVGVVELRDTCKLHELVRLFRTRGHLVANLDPLGRCHRGPWMRELGSCSSYRHEKGLVSLLDTYPYGGSPHLKAAVAARQLHLEGPHTPDRLFFLDNLLHRPLGQPHSEWWTLPEAIEHLHRSYCSTLAAETVHLPQQEAEWLQRRLEQGTYLLEGAQKLHVLQRLIAADALEDFLSRKYPASKRFGLEGCEAVVPGLQALVERSAGHGVRRVEVGMAHRGRLNVMVNVLGTPVGALCSEMEGRQSDFHVGDVKYHLGKTGTLRCRLPGGEERGVRVNIAANPSHLEAVNPVVLGMVRALQAEGAGAAEERRRKVMAVLIHGDAAFAGQGMVAECLQLSGLPGYTTGGTIHLIINNQVGFTTEPADGRSTPHPTDVARATGAPVLHANADDPQAVVAALHLAADWRATFGKDMVVDIVGFRRRGHNEQEDPSVTLPITYSLIGVHPPVLQLYSRTLQEEGLVQAGEVEALRQRQLEEWEGQWADAQKGLYRESARQFLESTWQRDALQAVVEATGVQDFSVMQEPTGLPLATLQRVGAAISMPPDNFQLHPEVRKLLAQRGKMVEGPDSRVDWAMAEALAFGTLLLHRLEMRPDVPPTAGLDPLGWGLNRGHYAVRLSGQDVERGTFNQRHAVLYDQATGQRMVALNSITRPDRQDRIEAWNSPLSEAAVLGFEYGYSLGARDRALVIWEAQFGDFANNAQVIVDQFIASGHEKWGQQSAVVLLLPHGYSGQGPDHSSARLERFLQLCADDPDHLPGHSPADRQLMAATFDAVSREYGGQLHREQALELLRSMGLEGRGRAGGEGELLELLWAEMGLPEMAAIGRASWEEFMRQYLRRNAETRANLFVVNATTPAQYFHALRRQVNLPHKRPLILLSPKNLLHHRPATSPLHDLCSPHFFRRVIQDDSPHDNLRNTLVDPTTGRPRLLPPDQIRRVIMCSGQIFYLLSRMRQVRRAWGVVLVRLEQIAPFPHDLMTRIAAKYPHAELVWCQEEPKNMGAWQYVQPRLNTALRQLSGGGAGGGAGGHGAGDGGEGTGGAARTVWYVGRPPAASPATASFDIHQRETREIVAAALADGRVGEQQL